MDAKYLFRLPSGWAAAASSDIFLTIMGWMISASACITRGVNWKSLCLQPPGHIPSSRRSSVDPVFWGLRFISWGWSVRDYVGGLLSVLANAPEMFSIAYKLFLAREEDGGGELGACM